MKEAINKLLLLLKDSVRNENSLQEILTSYPILFGTEYIEVLDKHSFGSDYEADYVLKRFNGLYDVVEIESSTLNIYTKQGNPSSQLVHAEQQIMDWLEQLLIDTDIKYLDTVFIYILSARNEIKVEEVKKHLSPKGGFKMISAADRLRREGKVEGRIEEKINNAKKMFRMGISEVQIKEITELSSAELAKIKDELDRE